jgi:uncharacterized protein (TIGR03437 family)
VFGFLLCHAALAQPYAISTFAGGLPPATPATAVAVSIGDPPRVATDSSGNVYFGSLHSIFKVDLSGSLTRIAGTGRAGYSGDGGPATAAQFQYPNGIAVDAQGNLYVSDRSVHVIRRISAGGIVSTIAGTGTAGFLGDGGPAAAAQLNLPAGLALDSSGNLYVADSGNNCVRRISGGMMTTFAGNHAFGPAFGGDGGQATSAYLSGPSGVAVDSAGNVYIADTFNDRVRMVASDGIIHTFAGTGLPGTAADNVPAISSPLFLPADVAVGPSGAVYIADFGNSLVRMVANGALTTAAGSSSGAPIADGLTAVSVSLHGPTGLAADSAGNLYFAEGSIGSGSGLAGGDFRIWKVTADGLFFTFAGNGWNSFSGDGGPASLAQLNVPAGLARDSQGNIYIADSANHRVRRIAPDGAISTIAGTGIAGFSGDGSPAIGARLNTPLAVAVNSFGEIFIADSANSRIRKIYSNGFIGTYAGTGNAGFFGDGGNASLAALHFPCALAVDQFDSLYVADALDYRVRKIDIGQNIGTFAGAGTQGSSGDGAPAIAAQLTSPVGVAADSSGNIYIADGGSNTVRMVSPAGIISTVPAGPLSGLKGIAVDGAGNLVLADAAANQIRQVSPAGAVTTIAGSGTCCYSGDGGPAPLAQLNQPWGLLPDGAGGLYVADSANNAIRLLRPGSGAPAIDAVVNGASNLAGPIAPGEVVVVYGTGIGPALLAQNQAAGGSLGTQLAGSSVLFNGVASPIIYASAAQVSAIVPYGVSGSTVQVVAQYQSASSAPVAVPLALAAPALFTGIPTGKGQAAAINQDNSLNSATRPAAPGSVIVLYATGEGQTTPAGVDGKIAAVPAPQPVQGVTVTIGGQGAVVQYAGGAPGSTAGLMQINAVIPSGIPSSNAVPVSIAVGAQSSPAGVTIAVVAQLPNLP